MLPGLSEKGAIFFAPEHRALDRTESDVLCFLYFSPGWCSSVFMLDYWFFFFFSYSPKNPYNLINVHLSRLVDEGSGERCIFPLASVDGRSVLVNNTLVFHYAIPDFWRRNLVSYQSKAILFVRNEALWLSLSEQTSREFIHPIHGCVINDSVLMDTGILKP